MISLICTRDNLGTTWSVLIKEVSLIRRFYNGLYCFFVCTALNWTFPTKLYQLQNMPHTKCINHFKNPMIVNNGWATDSSPTLPIMANDVKTTSRGRSCFPNTWPFIPVKQDVWDKPEHAQNTMCLYKATDINKACHHSLRSSHLFILSWSL